MDVIIQKKSKNPDYKKPVIIYQAKNYKGKSQKLAPGRYPLEKLEIDALSSIKTPDGKMVILHDQTNFQGDKRVIVNDVPDLGDFSDRTSALIVQLAAEVFEDSNYKGKRQTLPIGRYNMGDLLIDNDSISSVKTPPGLFVTLFDGPDLTGEKVTFIDDAPNVGKALENKASSIAVGLLKITVPDVDNVDDLKNADLSKIIAPEEADFEVVKKAFGK